ncbi:MAG: TetR/AcrR family transcriptional regulator, partial [Ruminococcus sp.]|nr:TetR/AcrR family transcriptional regulator [Ruminococcus sp.]
EKSGIDQIKELMKVFKVLYSSHKDFLRFIDSFDRFVIKEKIAQEELEEYERSVMDFFPLFESAYKNGCEDGTTREDVDFKTLYICVTHALMLMSEKFARGDVFMGESENAEMEMDCLIELAINRIKK